MCKELFKSQFSSVDHDEMELLQRNAHPKSSPLQILALALAPSRERRAHTPARHLAHLHRVRAALLIAAAHAPHLQCGAARRTSARARRRCDVAPLGHTCSCVPALMLTALAEERARLVSERCLGSRTEKNLNVGRGRRGR